MSDHPETALPYLEEENDPIDLTGDEVAPEVEEEASSVEEQPAPEEPTPAPAPQNTINDQLAQLLAVQTREAEARQQQAEEQRRQQQEAQRPKPLMEREDWRQRYEEALERSTYDGAARTDLARMNQELVREEAQSMFLDMRGELQLEMRADTALRSAVQSVQRQYGDVVTEADYMQVAQDVFGLDRANLARALDPGLNPQAAQVQQLLAETAAGRAFLSGRVQKNKQQTPPPNPRSATRTATPGKAKPSSSDMWTDTNYVNGVMADAWRRK